MNPNILKEKRKRLANKLNTLLIPDIIYISVKHYSRIGRWPNIRKPRSFNEHAQWLKVYGCTPLHQQCVDKYRVRDYVRDKIGEQYLIPLLGKHDSTETLNIDELPDKFVIKANHGSGWNALIHNKQEVNWPELIALMDIWLHTNFYNRHRERQYKEIQPCLIVEEMILDENGQIPSDIKIHCFQGAEGRKMIVQVNSEINGQRYFDFFDTDWNRLDIRFAKVPNSAEGAPKPAALSELLEISDKLSAEFAYVRVDLYEASGKQYFGELTFTPNAGFFGFDPDETDFILGKLIDQTI